MFWIDKNPSFDAVAAESFTLMNKYGFDYVNYLSEELPTIEKGCKMLVKAIGTVENWKASVVSKTPARVWFQNVKTKEIDYYYNLDVIVRRKIDAKIEKYKENIKKI